jgi:hypothetical protein
MKHAGAAGREAEGVAAAVIDSRSPIEQSGVGESGEELRDGGA